jgi:hypothetical protein
MANHEQIWRTPDEESIDLYPGLVVHDGRVSGSITTGQSRLPLWAFAWVAIARGWDEVELGWEPSRYSWTAEKMGEFIHDLLEMRGEFARLLLVMADAERCERKRGERPMGPAWWDTKKHRERVAGQLRRCLETLEDNPD